MKSLYRAVKAAVLPILLCALPAQAVVVTYTFEALITDGPFQSQFAPGSFSFDDSFLVTGNEVLGVAEGLEVSLTFDGQTFYKYNDVDWPDYPRLTFSNFNPIALDFLLVDGSNGVAFNDPGLAGTSYFMFSLMAPYGSSDFGAELSLVTVPLPASAWFLGSALVGLLSIRRRPAGK